MAIGFPKATLLNVINYLDPNTELKILYRNEMQYNWKEGINKNSYNWIPIIITWNDNSAILWMIIVLCRFRNKHKITQNDHATTVMYVIPCLWYNTYVAHYLKSGNNIYDILTLKPDNSTCDLLLWAFLRVKKHRTSWPSG